MSEQQTPVEWLMETLRITTFAEDDVETNGADWWNAVVGADPEATVSHPGQGRHQIVGNAAGGQLLLLIQGQRVDWLLRPVPTVEDASVESLPTLGSAQHVAAEFRPLIDKWLALDDAPHWVRLTYGPILLSPVDNRADGYRLLDTLLPGLQIDAEGSSDLLYHINRKRPFETGGKRIEINRMSKWSVASWEATRLTISTTGIGQAPLGEGYACRLELDINTVPCEGTDYTSEQASAIMHELQEMAFEIVREGDIP